MKPKGIGAKEKFKGIEGAESLDLGKNEREKKGGRPEKERAI